MTHYSIVFSSQTGNTARLAQALVDRLPAQGRLYAGAPAPEAAAAPLLFIGFWTCKGDCDAQSAAFLQTLQGKRVFLFGTAGFGGDGAYFARILARTRSHLDASNALVGSYMCQGRMPQSARQRYEALLPQHPEKMQALMDNFDRAASHPDAEDLARLIQAAEPFA